MNETDINNLNHIIKTVYGYFSDDDDYLFTNKSFYDFKFLVKQSIDIFYPELSYLVDKIDDLIVMKSFTIEIKQNDINKLSNKTHNIEFTKLKFKTCKERDAFYDEHRKIFFDLLLDEEQKRLFAIYEHLAGLEQPAQKSPEWFAKRNGMLTASSCGAAIGRCHHPKSTIKAILLDKVGLGEKFKENKFVYHGKKYEKIANMIYEHLYNTKVGEFGLIGHPTISYLGASPDGISMALTLDGKINSLLGVMLEIKCPPARPILNKGKICGDIIPEYYWIQVQVQLECCNLPDCHFWQCHITEYKTVDEFIKDPVDDSSHTENFIKNQDEHTFVNVDHVKIKMDERLRKGAIIELLPIDRSVVPQGDMVIWYGKYIYPPTLLMTADENIKWANDTIKDLDNQYPEITKNYKFSRVVYWKLMLSHNELVTRQQNWFDDNKHLYKQFWDRVLYYRSRLDEAKEDILNQRLSNDTFLKTITNKIPKRTSSTNSSDSNEIFINSTKCKKDKNDVFIDSSDSPKNKSIFIKQIVPKKQNNKKDIFIDDSNKTIVKKMDEPIPKPIPLYKEMTTDQVNNDDMLDLVMIMENRKKKNMK